MHVRVELALRLDGLHAVPLEQPRQRAVHEADTLFELRFLVLLGGVQRALEVVEDREELADQPLVGERDVLLPLASRPLLVVLEVGGEPEQTVVLRHRLLLFLLDLFGLFLLKVLLGHEVGASSSTTSYSPSSTTSSSEEAVASPLPLPEACACCAASA